MTRSGKQRNKVPTNAQVSADESTRIHINQVLRDFRDSAEDVYTFEADLTNAERASVHVLCRKMGLASKSSGNGNQRCVSVYKNKSQNSSENDKKQKLNKEEEKLSYLAFSEETQGVLRDLFTRYPPNEEQTEVLNANCKQEYDKRGRKKDDSFCKPSMTQIEIAAKMESFASRLNKSPKFNQIVKDRVKLPIAAFKDTITSTVESHQVVLISGETGCGKTTQVPQFLLDDMWGKGQACKIICTQPRRISAISVAERISYERGEPVGDNIGYKIRMETKGGKHSSVMFCTNGVLLRVLVGKGTSKLNARAKDISSKDDNLETTHIIVDEIHERDRFSDFMLAILRDMLPSYPNLRLILMSATLDAERFSQYFGGCPIIRVPGFTFPVRTFYLEDVLSILKSTDCNHLDSASLSHTAENGQSTEDDMAALDEAIDLAWSSDEFVPLLELITCESTLKACNYQHSLTRISPLMVFAGKGRVGDVCMLLSLGADCHLRADDGKTALDCAQQENHEEVVQILKDHLDNSLSKSAAKEELLQTYLASINPEHIDIILIERLVRKICIDSKEGAILVFLPGWDDINKTRERLHASPFFGDTRKFVIQPLHSMVPAFEQKKVFGHPPPGSRKIILSTNIAETAVTIDDVVYVIDSGRMKEKSYDPYNNVSTLHSSWISKASARQREGRAGRCLPGICYHLYSRTRATSLPEFQIPEIKRMPIEELCLQVKMLDPNCKIEDFLQKTLDPPVFETIRNAIAVLRDIGALTVDESLTELGEKLGSLPVHPSVSKMLFFAILMNCLDPALTLACASDYRDPFILPVAPTERQQALSAKTEFASLYGGHSDQLMVIAAFECWKRAKDNGQEARFCARYFVSAATMRMLSSMRMQLRRELIRNGFIQEDDSCSQNAQDPAILHAVLVAGLYPMVGKLLPPHKYGQRPVVETASGAKVRLHPHSSNFKLSLKKSKCPSLVVYDEITRGDGGMYIRNCTVVGPYPLLFLATDLVVAPSKGNDDEESDEEDYASGSDEDGMEIHVPSSKQPGERIMSSPDNTVSVIIDHWLTFQSTALDVAQIYCLRERLSAAILFKVMHPTKVLPPDLGASIYAIACVLSYDGLSGILPSMKPVNLSTSMANAAESNSSTAGEEGNQNISKFLMSLMSNKDMWQNQYRRPMTVSNVIRGSNRLDSNMSPSCASHNTPSQGPASGGNGSGRNPKRHFSKRRCGAPH